VGTDGRPVPAGDNRLGAAAIRTGDAVAQDDESRVARAGFQRQRQRGLARPGPGRHQVRRGPEETRIAAPRSGAGSPREVSPARVKAAEPSMRLVAARGLIGLLTGLFAGPAGAQDLTPRAYTLTPVSSNAFVVSYLFTTGDIL